MKNLFLLISSFFIFTGAFAQYNNFKALGDKAFKDKNYYEAAYYYKSAADGMKALPTDVPFYSSGKTTKRQIKAERPYICYQLAESYRLYQNYAEAEEWYHKILTENYELAYPLARLWYGVCLRTNDHFDESIKQLKQFNATYKGDKKFIDIANKEISTSLFSKEKHLSPLSIEVTKMPEQWNADGGDYALVKTGGNYWFTSSRMAKNNKKHLDQIYTATAQNSGNPIIVNLKYDGSKKDMEYSTPTLTNSGKRMYLTGWYKEGSKTILAIYYAELGNKTWSPLQKLNSNVNTDGFSALQPFVTADGKRLFFVSDKPGGQGGYDIWVSNLDDSGNPVNSVNLGKTINTPYDEEAPFYDQIHKRLVYSSKGFIGLGGFDFFESYEGKSQWSAPNNLGYPINSSKDDLYYYPDPDNSVKFYISSDRESACCLNLFQLRYKSNFITGTIVDCDANKTLPVVRVSLIDSVSKQTIKVVETGKNANYIFEVIPKHAYKLVFEKTGYFAKTITASVKPGTDTLLNPDICLQAYKVNKPIEIKNILYDFNQAVLRPESKVALNALVTIMADNPRLKIEIGSHTDSIGNDAYNLKLSQQRAQSCVDYIISKGIEKDRIVARGYGKSVPIAPNSLPNGKDNPAGRQINRRTEFTVK